MSATFNNIKINGTHPIGIGNVAPIFSTTLIQNGITYDVKLDDCILLVDTHTSTTTINLDTNPMPNGKIIIIKDYKGEASTGNITIAAGNAIDWSTGGLTMSNDWGSATLVYEETTATWYAVAIL